MFTVYEWDTFEIKCIVLYHVSQPFWNLRKLQLFTVWSFPAGKPTFRCHHGWESLLEMEALMGTCSFIMRIYRHVWLLERTWEIFTDFWQIKRHAKITRLVEGKIYTMLSPNRGLSCKYSLKVMRKKNIVFLCSRSKLRSHHDKVPQVELTGSECWGEVNGMFFLCSTIYAGFHKWDGTPKSFVLIGFSMK